MAKKPLKGNYLTLEDVRISYDKKTDSIHLTSKDKDLPDGGFHLTLNKGREAEQALRSLLIDAGMAQSKEENDMPVEDFRLDEQFYGITLGRGANGKAIRWTPETSPHMFISGGTGRGKSVLLRNIVYSALIHNGLNESGNTSEPSWEFYIADTKGIGLSADIAGTGDLHAYLHDPKFVKKYVHSFDGIESMLQDACDEMIRRYAVLSDHKVVSNRFLLEPFPRRMIIIDEGSLLFHEYGTGLTPSVKAQREKIQMLLHEITRKSRAAGIHLVVASQDPGLLYGELKGNFATKIAVGKHTKPGSFSLLGNNAASLISDEKRGRCFIQDYDHNEEFQMFVSNARVGQDIAALLKDLKQLAKEKLKDQKKNQKRSN